MRIRWVVILDSEVGRVMPGCMGVCISVSGLVCGGGGKVEEKLGSRQQNWEFLWTQVSKAQKKVSKVWEMESPFSVKIYVTRRLEIPPPSDGLKSLMISITTNYMKSSKKSSPLS